ncbi:hypothetical protein CISIN_1g0013262mg, partial [Citrus sinensis]
MEGCIDPGIKPIRMGFQEYQ